jgi:photosystem II stability/assembly factor-like uncharacterized protein
MKIYILAFLLLFTVFSFSILRGSHSNPKTEKAGPAKIVFKSTDGGQTWQDISKGLPENLVADSIRGNYANDKGLFLRVENVLYRTTPNATAPFWIKEILPDEHNSIAPGKSGTVYWGVNVKKTNGTIVWSPIFKDFPSRFRSVFETAGGGIFIGTDSGFFKTDNDGKTWKHVYTGGFAGNLAESNGVLVAIGMKRIIRSTDNGENWEFASEGFLAFDVKPVRGGFVAMTSTSASNPKGLMTSYDRGKTWQPIDAGPQGKVLSDAISGTWNDRINDRLRAQSFSGPIIQVGENFFFSHRNGIFRSSDKGKTWKLLLPSAGGKVFNLLISGNVIYATRSKGGC